MGIIWLLVVGLVAGFLARAIVPGKDDLGIVKTIVLGIVGSLVGGFVGYAIFGKDPFDGAFQTSGFLGSVVGAVVVLLAYNAVTGRKRIHA